MTKSELQTGMIITTREGKEYVFVKDFIVNNNHTMESCDEGILVNGQIASWTRLVNYNCDMKHKTHKPLDIMKVEIADHPYAFTNIQYDKSDRKLVWERKDPKQMTVAEIEAILGYKIEIVSDK